MVNQNFKNLSIMTTVYIFTHVFMLISVLAIGWLAASSDNENIDVEIKSVAGILGRIKQKCNL
jgi:hypothetical protein